MVGRGLGRLAGRVTRTVRPAAAKVGSTDFVRTLREAYEAGKRGEQPTEAGDVDSVAEAMRGLDWAKVKATTAERSGDVAEAMRAMAAEVDWTRVQAGAARVSSALIAAVASGQLPVRGRLAGPIARAIIDDGGLAQQVSTTLTRSGTATPDFGPDLHRVIDTTGRDAP